MTTDAAKPRKKTGGKQPGAGRPSGCTELMIERAHRFSLMGYTLEEIANALDVAPRTVDNWMKKVPAFRAAVLDGRDLADSAVVQSLYNQAVGFEGKDKKYYPPNATASIFWLKNRQKALWRDKQEVEHSGEIAYKDLTDEELDHRIKQFALAQAKPD